VTTDNIENGVDRSVCCGSDPDAQRAAARDVARTPAARSR
jgi:hypothetical protein